MRFHPQALKPWGFQRILNKAYKEYMAALKALNEYWPAHKEYNSAPLLFFLKADVKALAERLKIYGLILLFICDPKNADNIDNIQKLLNSSQRHNSSQTRKPQNEGGMATLLQRFYPDGAMATLPPLLRRFNP